MTGGTIWGRYGLREHVRQPQKAPPMTTNSTTRSITQAPFGAADQKFAALKDRLIDTDSLGLEHSAVERLIETDGREVLRELFQSHLRVRSMEEVQVVPVGEDGKARGHCRMGTSRPLMSIFGPVTVTRRGYSARGHDSRFPLDGALNLPPEKQSLEVQRRVARLVAQSSFDDATAQLAETTGASVAKRQVEEIAVRAAQDFDAFYAETVHDISPEKTSALVVVTTDGKGVVMHKQDLRPATRLKAEQQGKPKKRLGSGEKKQRKRMATVAAVYTLGLFFRTADDVVHGLRPVQDVAERMRGPKPELKRMWASLSKEPEEVIEEAFQEGLGRDLNRNKRWVALVDGDKHQLARIRRVAAQHGIDITIVLDLIHVIEYLWKASHAFNKPGTAAAQRWVDERLHRLLCGEASSVAGGIRRAATMRKLSKTRRKQADKCADYLLNNAEYVRYDTYLAEGLPIATGVIEGACRHLVRDRMDLTGARWRLPRAEAVLRLRALRSSGDFEPYWQFHEEQEAKRNHASRYERGQLPAVTHPPPRSHLRLVKA